MVNSSYEICLVLVAITTVSGCFITNCPPGGKRSGIEPKIRQCEQCGPAGSSGRCYGPTICCSPEFGCMMGTPETFSCQIENRFTTLCQNPGASCSGTNGELNNGQCGAEGICCNSEMCMMDDTCHDEAARDGIVKSAGGIHQRGSTLDRVFQRFLIDGRHRLPARLPFPTSSSSGGNDY